MGMFDKVKENSVIKKASELDEKNKSRKQEKASRKQNIKNGEKILKDHMGTKIKANEEFFRRLREEGITSAHQWPVWYKINGQVKKELKEEILLPQEIPQRLEELVVENGNPDKKAKFEEKNQNNAIRLGVEGYDFQCSLNEIRTNTFGKKKEEVSIGYCFVKEDCLIIKKFSAIRKNPMGDKVLPFSNINAIDFDKAHGLQMTSSIVIAISGLPPVVLKNTRTNNFKLLHDAWVNFNNKSNEPVPTVIESKSTAADELLKWHDLYEKGVISEEEFEQKKQELL